MFVQKYDWSETSGILEGGHSDELLLAVCAEWFGPRGGAHYVEIYFPKSYPVSDGVKSPSIETWGATPMSST